MDGITSLLSVKEISGYGALLITIYLLLRHLNNLLAENSKNLEAVRIDFNTRLREFADFSERRMKEANDTHEKVMMLTAQNYTANTEKQVQAQEKMAALMTSKLDENIRISELTQTVVQSHTLRQIQQGQ